MHRAVLLALAVVLAGCGGLGALDGGETRTLTPVSVPSENPDGAANAAGTSTATATPEPSVVDAIQGDPLAAVAIHERRLRGTGFRVRVAHAVVDGPTYVLNATVGDDRYRGTVRRTDGAASDRYRQGYYNNREALYVRVAGRDDDGSTTVSYRSLPPSFSLPFDATRGEQLRGMFGSADLEIVQVVDAGREGGFYRARAPRTTVAVLPAYPAPVRNATVRNLTVTVTTGGVVSAYSFEYVGTRNGSRVAGRVRVEVDPVERPALRAPDWYEKALANTSRVALIGTPRSSSASPGSSAASP